ncbi:MAG: alpha/beta hydrolase, partial [Myxococcales bacterium]
DRVADETFAQGRASPAVVVFVPLHEQRERMDEYSFGTNSSRGDRFRAFLADTLVPLVDAAFPTRADVAQRGITGASLGGLMSSYVAWGRNDRFQLVGSQSGSYFWVDDKELLTHEMRAGEKRTLRLYVDNGSPGDNERSNASFVQMLKDRGYPHVHVVEPGGRHEWPDWARRWPAMLAYLFPP